MNSQIWPRLLHPNRSPNTATALSLLIFIITTPPARTYLGPTHCIKRGTTAAAAFTQQASSSTVGYSTFNHLLFDMVSLSASFRSGHPVPDERLVFRICPGATIDLDDSSLPLGFLPIEVPRLTLQCGDHGRLADGCVIRGGGKRDPSQKEWNTHPQRSYKNSASGILGGGRESVAQVYVYGESAYEITLSGLTFDNSPSQREVWMYREYVARFGQEPLQADDDGIDGQGRGEEKIEQEYDVSVPSSSSSAANDNSGGGAGDGIKNNKDSNRNIQETETQPARRFASVAVRGKGYGDDAGPRLITIEDCRFQHHRGYAIIVSPGIQQPNMPVAPEFKFPTAPSLVENSQNGYSSDISSVNLQSSGQIYNQGSRPDNSGNKTIISSALPQDGVRRRKERELNLLEEEKYIPNDGLISYYDDAAGRNYLDGRRVKLARTEFASNVVSGDTVAGLVTSAYSLTLIDCFFRKNDAKSMVFVYNNEALVEDTIFEDNTVEVSTVVMASPKGSKPRDKTTTKNGGPAASVPRPTHIVERSCFRGSHVGMSNVLVTDVENTGFGQRDNHASRTHFTWVSKCEGGAAEKLGNDCMETGRCDGTCVEFTSELCLAERAMFFNAGMKGKHGRGALALLAVLIASASMLA